MRCPINILTPVTSFCLFITAYDCPAQEAPFDQTILQKATEEADTTFLAIHCNEQTDDPRLAHVSTPSKRARSSSEVLPQPIFLKQPLLFSWTGPIGLTASGVSAWAAYGSWKEILKHLADAVVKHSRVPDPLGKDTSMERLYDCTNCMKTFKVSSVTEPSAEIPETQVSVSCPVCKAPNTVTLPQGAKFIVAPPN